METLGIDIGNYNIKTASGIIFPARYSTKETLLETNDCIEINGVPYYIGCGTFETKLNKAEKQNILPLLYTAIIKSTSTPLVNIVLGLPANQFKANKNKLKEAVLANKMVGVKFNGNFRTIVIENCEVFPEGAGAYFSLADRPKNCILIDIGGRTTNIILFENGKIKKFDSKALGMINIYSRIRETINSGYTLDLGIEDIEGILKEGLYVDNCKIDMEFIKPIIQTFLDELMNELELNYPIRTNEVLLAGGGAFLLLGVLQKKIARLHRIENYIFANAEGFRKVGLSIWKDED